MERMWEMLAAPLWDRVDEDMLGRVVAGEALVARADKSEGTMVKKRMVARGNREGEVRLYSGGGRGRCGSSSSESGHSAS
jgi:hypothetical protein